MHSKNQKQLARSKKLIPKSGKSFEMASSWLKWLHLGGFSTNYERLICVQKCVCVV
jgi:hypothetical protein